MENVLSFYEKVWDEINDNLKNLYRKQERLSGHKTAMQF